MIVGGQTEARAQLSSTIIDYHEPFDQGLRHQLSDLSRKIDAVVQPVYVSKKIKWHFKPKEHKPPIVNQQNVVYHYKCGLCDTDYVAFTSRHLHQRVEELKARFKRRTFHVPNLIPIWVDPNN